MAVQGAKYQPIVKADLIAFLDTSSDFAFELKIFKMLSGLGLQCQHSGSYTDTVQKKVREFDIRAAKRFEERYVRLAVECKNISDMAPLLFSCVSRTNEESFHEIILSGELGGPYYTGYRCRRDSSFYQPNTPVAKSVDQVMKKQNGEAESNDKGIYDKWAQSLSSADELIRTGCTQGTTGSLSKPVATLVIPMVIVPDRRMWAINYDHGGNRIGEPEPVNRCSYFVNREYAIERYGETSKHFLSHVEFLTEPGLKSFVEKYLLNSNDLEGLMPFQELSVILGTQFPSM